MLNLYDEQIVQLKNLFVPYSCDSDNKNKESWPLQDKEDLVLKSDMAFELGGGNAFAVSGILFTVSDSLVSENSVFCMGDNFSEYAQDSSVQINYARIVVVKLKEGAVNNRTNQQLYALFRKMEYQRYHSFLQGTGLRVSSLQNREVIRISKAAFENGISLYSMGKGFIDSFLSLGEVEKVNIYMASSKDAGDNKLFDSLKAVAQKADNITSSLNEIFKGLKMDCSVCGQKNLCDEISGMKELHKSSVSSSQK